MRILTAFTNSLGGRDSYHLGVSLAEAFSCPLDLVTVVKGGEGRYVLDVTDHAFQDVVATQVDDWMSEIMEEHRPRVPVSSGTASPSPRASSPRPRSSRPTCS